LTARRILLPFAALALVAAAFVLPFGSSSNSNADAVTALAEPVTAFTVMDDGQGLCDLYTIDLASGVLTDLPAASSEAACALDLAVAADGTVYGISDNIGFFSLGSVSPAADSLGSAELITFSADGTPSGLTLTVGGFPIGTDSFGSIAIDAAGTVYVIAVNETTCYPSDLEVVSFEPSDTTMFSCLFTVNLSSGELTQIGDAFSPDQPVLGLTSCASDMWSLMPGLIDDFGVGQSPASVGVPWASIDPTTAIPTEAGISTQLLGFDCVATGNTVYAMSTGFGLTANDITPSAPAGADLGTVDPTTGVFTETAATSNPSGYIFPWAFAVLPISVEPEPETETEPAPVAPIFTR
jgi:hypothetical protein